MSSVERDVQRFTPDAPCPICGGDARKRSGSEGRCYGFRGDGVVFCSSKQSRGRLTEPTGPLETYAHKLTDCACGMDHQVPRTEGARWNIDGPSPMRAEVWYDVKNLDGEIIARHRRQDFLNGTKDMKWFLPDDTPGLGGVSIGSLPLYGTERLRDLPTSTPVVITEGEKACEALWAVGIAAVGTVTGAAGTPGDAALRALDGRPVITWPDADQIGREHMRRIERALRQRGHRDLRTVVVDGASEGDDAADLFTPETFMPDNLSPWGTVERMIRPVTANTPLLVKLSDVAREPIAWFCPKRFAFGHLHVLLGDPDAGKSTFTRYLAACGSRPLPIFPDVQPVSFVTIFLTSEDAIAQIVRPNVEAHGGDPSQVYVLRAVRDEEDLERPFNLDQDLQQLDQAVDQTGGRVVVFDPLSSYFGTGTDSYKDSELRRVLDPLAKFAADRRVCVISILHPTKAEDRKMLYRANGGLANTASARVAHVIVPDQDNPRRRLLMTYKNNLAGVRYPQLPAIAYVSDGEGPETRIIVERNTVDTVDLEAALRSRDPDERSRADEAVQFLNDLFADRKEWLRTEVLESAKRLGIAARTVDRARGRARIMTTPVKNEQGAVVGSVWRQEAGQAAGDRAP